MAREFRRRDYIPIVVYCTSGGVPINLTETTVKVKLGQRPAMTAAITKTLTVTDAVGGVAEGALTTTDTANLVGEYLYTITRTPADGVERIMATGSMYFENTIG